MQLRVPAISVCPSPRYWCSTMRSWQWTSSRRRLISSNYKKSQIQDEYIEKYLAEKNLDLIATLDAEAAYKDADFVVILCPPTMTARKDTTAS